VPDLPPNVTVKAGLRGSFDVAIVFVRSAAELKRRAAQVVRTTRMTRPFGSRGRARPGATRVTLRRTSCVISSCRRASST